MTPAALLAAWEQGATQPPLRRALTLLAAARPERSPDDLARASVGERDAMLLRLREELFGDALEATAECPKCGEPLELAFGTDDVRVPPPAPGHDLRLEAFGYEVRFRPPNSADLLALAGSEPERAREALLLRCVVAASRAGGPAAPDELPEDVLAAVSNRMAEADPQADVSVALTCPSCSHAWSMLFDILSYLWSEVDDWAERLLLEVHQLASAYGWSESDILALGARRRRIYLELVGA